MAVCWVAPNSRSAIRARMRVIGTRFSIRSLVGPSTFKSTAPGVAAGEAGADDSGAGCAGACFRWDSTSSLSSRPPLPVATIFSGERPYSSSNARTAGPIGMASVVPAAAPESASPDVETSAAGACVAAAPAVSVANNASLVMASPSATMIASMTPGSGATTSITTLSVSISTSSSSRATLSPGPLCQAETTPSATDSGKAGALISTVIPASSY